MIACRSCGHLQLLDVLQLGDTPLANSLVDASHLDREEARYPLDVVFCPACSLVQLTVSVPPEQLFTEYAYFSSFADAVIENASRLTERLVPERGLGPESLVMEIASNDGYLLRNYAQLGVPVLGIDPARNITAAAEANGVPTVCDFFGLELAERLRREGRRADVLHANNVLAHVPDINGVVGGIARVLSDAGIAVIETPYVRDMVDRLEFDTIYHEHLFYYSLTALEQLLRRHGLRAVDVESIPIHGGSLRVTASATRFDTPTAAVATLLAEERRVGITDITYYRDFTRRVDDLCDRLRDLLGGLKAEGKRIAAYGAAAKGATLLNHAGIGTDTIDFVVDRNIHKHGRCMPGAHVPIRPTEALLDDQPDYVLLLAWNFVEEVTDQQGEYLSRGGRFIVPIPEPTIL